MEDKILKNGEVLVFRNKEPREHVCCDCGLRYMVTLEIQEDNETVHAMFARTDRVLDEIVNLSREEAKKLIHGFIKDNEGTSYADIVEELNLDLELVVDVCSELSREGKVEEEVELE